MRTRTSKRTVPPFLGWAAAVGFLLLGPRAFGTVYSTVDLAGPLEGLGHSARATAMGMAFVAVGGDPACLDWNPAGLSGLSSARLSLNHDSWLLGVNQENFVLALPAAKAGTFALGSTFADYGSLDGYDMNGSSTGSYQPYRLSWEMGWGREFSPGVSFGLAVEGLRQTISQVTANDYFASLGALWWATRSLRFAAAYCGYGIMAPDFPASGVLRVGLCWSPPSSKQASTLLAASLAMPPYGVYRLQFGAEENLWSDFFFRAGYQYDLVDNQIPGLQYLSAGFGLRLGDFDLDYAFLPMGDLGSSQRVGLVYRFGEKKAVSQAPPRAKSPEELTQFAPPPGTAAPQQVEKVEVKFNLPENPGPNSLPAPIGEAIRQYEKFLQDHPQNAQAWQALGRLYIQAGRREEGLQCLEESLQLQPDNTALKNWLGEQKEPEK